MQGYEAQQTDLHYLHKPVGTHKMAECGVPGTIVVPQYEEVGCHVEQQEYHQETANQGDEYFLGD
jgi:hypothetical protein